MVRGMSSRTQRPDLATLRALSVRHSVDPRSILAELGGRRVRGMAGQRARDAVDDWRQLTQAAPEARRA